MKFQSSQETPQSGWGQTAASCESRYLTQQFGFVKEGGFHAEARSGGKVLDTEDAEDTEKTFPSVSSVKSVSQSLMGKLGKMGPDSRFVRKLISDPTIRPRPHNSAIPQFGL